MVIIPILNFKHKNESLLPQSLSPMTLTLNVTKIWLDLGRESPVFHATFTLSGISQCKKDRFALSNRLNLGLKKQKKTFDHFTPI
jgi:cell division FtsZ-interacting protein ZapD